MGSRKTEFRFFTIPEWEKEQEYLRQRHREGWKFTGVSFIGLYHFVRAEPEDVVYQLDYNQEGVAHREEYVRMFQDCGWEYLQDYVGYSYFRKSADRMGAEEGIFCDAQSRLEMMERVFRGRFLPLAVVCLLVFLPGALYLLAEGGPVNQVMGGLLLGLFLLYILLFLQFAGQYLRCRRQLR